MSLAVSCLASCTTNNTTNGLSVEGECIYIKFTGPDECATVPYGRDVAVSTLSIIKTIKSTFNNNLC